jgi:uncharacterized phage protein (TIGR01671 family)
MQREIKFRAWDTVTREWRSDYSVLPDCRIWTDDEQASDSIVLMQFIGLTDKNGKEIYEGDVIRHEDQIWVRPVEFYDGRFWPMDETDVHPLQAAVPSSGFLFPCIRRL